MDGIVILVDNKVRDLNSAALIAHHIRRAGIECHLEPLEAYRAVLAAYKPAMIVFNHLTASHLAAYSNRLHEMGVLTAVLPNEGISYSADDMRYIAGRYHKNAHIDYFFCWNKHHQEALVHEGFGRNTRIEVVGVPRFDFYFEPWASAVRGRSRRTKARPNVLVCTNFIFAQHHSLPKSATDKVFAPWVGKVKSFSDSDKVIEVHWRSRNKLPEYLQSLLADGGFDVTLRPHPSEDKSFYLTWLESVSPADRERVHYDATSPITSLILDCDVEISCNMCLTALESWIVKRPTIELYFEGSSIFDQQRQDEINVRCDEPTKLPTVVRQQLDRIPSSLQKLREQHLEEWCATPNGTSAARLANVIIDAVRNKKNTDWSSLSTTDVRRGMKLKLLRTINEAYHFDPFLRLKSMLFKKRYAIKKNTYLKSIKPSDVRQAEAQFSALS